MMPNDDRYEYEETVEDDKSGEEHQESINTSMEEGSKGDEGSSSANTWKVLTVEGEIESVKRKSGRKRSQIWCHFMKANEGKSARCNYCRQVLSFAGSLSNLLRHLRKKHPSIVQKSGLTNGLSNAPGIILDSSLPVDSLILEVEGSRHGRFSSEPLRLMKTEPTSPCSRKMKTSDIEFVLKRDHSYIEHPSSQTDSLFAQFIQSEINKFQNEYFKRKCKREILQALMKYQQEEDDLYSVGNNDGDVDL